MSPLHSNLNLKIAVSDVSVSVSDVLFFCDQIVWAKSIKLWITIGNQNYRVLMSNTFFMKRIVLLKASIFYKSVIIDTL
jgi:hypothetical protein